MKIIYLRWEFNQFQFVYLSNGFILKKEILTVLSCFNVLSGEKEILFQLMFNEIGSNKQEIFLC